MPCGNSKVLPVHILDRFPAASEDEHRDACILSCLSSTGQQLEHQHE